MRIPIRILGLVAALNTALLQHATAASLQIAPILLEVYAPAGATAITLRNSGALPLTAQVRIYRWRQTNGSDELIETRDVVASPPLIEIRPNDEQIVRVVRVTKTVIDRDESYRVWIDEIPQASSNRGTAVDFAVRYSVPLFFVGAGGTNSRPLDWRVLKKGQKIEVTAHNGGDRHVRVSALKLRTRDGQEASFGAGLTGYVLGNSSITWALRSHLPAAAGDQLTLSAMTDGGAIQQVTVLQGAR